MTIKGENNYLSGETPDSTKMTTVEIKPKDEMEKHLSETVIPVLRQLGLVLHQGGMVNADNAVLEMILKEMFRLVESQYKVRLLRS